jgi:hypothetical protein
MSSSSSSSEVDHRSSRNRIAEGRHIVRKLSVNQELTVRFVVPERGVRDMKDRMARQILGRLAAARIEVASATIEIARVPPIEMRGLAPSRPS